jgi:NTE family protein
MAKTKPHHHRAIRLNLALQGGGAHGAYSWGVLDRLLEEDDIELIGISGTSAGAMNAVVVADGLNKGGRKQAQKQLAEFWQKVSGYQGVFAPPALEVDDSVFKQFSQGWNLAYGWMETLSRNFSPYELNPLNINPLRDVLAEMIDFDRLHAEGSLRLFITATNVETGQPQVFRCEDVTLDALMASACIPFLFQAVEIDGTSYWDGGYMGNPSIWPLVYHTDCDDILLVQINPLERKGTPTRSLEIIDRLNEISFNSSLVAEMRAIHFVKKLIAGGKLDDEEYKDIRMHMIAADKGMKDFTAATKLAVSWDFFRHLHDIGYRLAGEWIKKHKAAIGHEGTLDIEKVFLRKAPAKYRPPTSTRSS